MPRVWWSLRSVVSWGFMLACLHSRTHPLPYRSHISRDLGEFCNVIWSGLAGGYIDIFYNTSIPVCFISCFDNFSTQSCSLGKVPTAILPPKYPSIQHSGHIAVSQREPRQGSRFTFSLTVEIHLANKFHLIAFEVTTAQAFRQSWLVSRHDLLLLLLHLPASTASILSHRTPMLSCSLPPKAAFCESLNLQ